MGQAHIAYQRGNHLQERRLIQQALTTFRVIDERHGEAHAQMNLGFWFSERGDFQPAHDHFTRAATLFQQTNQTHLVNWARTELGWLAYSRGDYDEALTIFNLVLQTSKEIGDFERVADGLDGLADVYAAFGYYEQAIAQQTEAWEQREGHGRLLDVAWSLIKLSQIENNRADFVTAQRYCQQAKELFVQVKSPHELGRVLHEQGWSAFGVGDYEQANRYFREAWELHQRFDQRFLAAEDATGILMVQLASKQLLADERPLATVLDYLDENPALVGAERPFWVYLTCYQALAHLHDSQADTLLRQGHALLQERAQKISDRTYRHAYLTNVVWQRELARLYRGLLAKGVDENGPFMNNQSRFSLS